MQKAWILAQFPPLDPTISCNSLTLCNQTVDIPMYNFYWVTHKNPINWSGIIVMGVHLITKGVCDIFVQIQTFYPVVDLLSSDPIIHVSHSHYLMSNILKLCHNWWEIMKHCILRTFIPPTFGEIPQILKLYCALCWGWPTRSVHIEDGIFELDKGTEDDPVFCVCKSCWSIECWLLTCCSYTCTCSVNANDSVQFWFGREVSAGRVDVLLAVSTKVAEFKVKAWKLWP